MIDTLRQLRDAFGRGEWASLIMGFLAMVYFVLDFVLGLAGNLDFLVSRSKDPGWLSDVAGFLVAPPAWVIWPSLALVGVLVVVPIVRASRRIQHRDPCDTASKAQGLEVRKDSPSATRRDPHDAWVAANIDKQRARYLQTRTQTEEGIKDLLSEWRSVVDDHEFKLIQPNNPVTGFVGEVSFRREALYPEMRPFLSDETQKKIERNYPPPLQPLQGIPLAEIQRLIHRDLDLVERYWMAKVSEPQT